MNGMMLTLLKVFLVATFASCVVAELELVWEDNFDSFDESKWSHTVSGWANNLQFQYFRNNSKNRYIEDGVLYLRATPASDEHTDEEMRNGVQREPDCNVQPCRVTASPDGNTIKPVYSARIHTDGKFSVGYGRVEVTAKLPRGDWVMAAIWMMPHEEYYGGWPRSGEIDIVEISGNRNYKVNATGASVGADTIHSTYILGKSCVDADMYTQWRDQLQDGTDYSDDFHTFSVERTPSNMTFFVDDRVVGFIKPPKGGFWELAGYPTTASNQVNAWSDGDMMAPFDTPFYLILQVVVAGRWFKPDWVNGAGTPFDIDSGRAWTQFYEAQDEILATWDRPFMAVDRVRVYEWK